MTRPSFLFFLIATILLSFSGCEKPNSDSPGSKKNEPRNQAVSYQKKETKYEKPSNSRKKFSTVGKKQKKTNVRIKQINLEIDGSCNIKCQFCPQSTGREASFLKKMPLPVFYKIIEEALPLGLTHVNLSGSGEPLLNKELEKAVRFLSQNNIITMIENNGLKYIITIRPF